MKIEIRRVKKTIIDIDRLEKLATLDPQKGRPLSVEIYKRDGNEAYLRCMKSLKLGLGILKEILDQYHSALFKDLPLDVYLKPITIVVNGYGTFTKIKFK